MSAPTPLTRTSIVLLRLSKVRPSGTWKIPGMSIQFSWGAEMLGWRKIQQLQTKLISTAAFETMLLSVFDRRVNSVITAALNNGARRTTQGELMFLAH